MIAKNPVIGTFSGKACDYTVFNNNDMKLGRELFANLISSEEYKRAMQNRYYIGYLGHPEDPNCMDFRNGCIVMTDMEMHDDGNIWASFDLVDTPVGRVVKTFIDAGVTFGISIRGAGDLDAEGNVDPDTFVFRGFDLVTFPAYDDCVPEFQEIAASSSLDKQVKYKKVCAAISKNLKDITSAEAIETIREQFREDQAPYQELTDRLDELNPEIDPAEELKLVQEKLDGVTALLIEEKEKNAELEQQCADAQIAANNANIACSRKIESYRRLAQRQINDIEIRHKSAVNANRRLRAELHAAKQDAIFANKELETVKESNLKYVHKIEANSDTISQKESTISALQDKLSKTVTASQKLERKASNLDGTVEELKSRVEAAEQMVLEYQQSYANMYANALGVCLNNLSITAATKPDELRAIISSATSTSNMMAEADILEDEDLLEGELIDDDTDNGGIVAL